MIDDKFIAIVGLVAISIYAIYQGGAEAYELVKIITSGIAGFVTGTAYISLSRKPKVPPLPPIMEKQDNLKEA